MEYEISRKFLKCEPSCSVQTDRETERQSDGKTDGRTDRHYEVNRCLSKFRQLSYKQRRTWGAKVMAEKLGNVE